MRLLHRVLHTPAGLAAIAAMVLAGCAHTSNQSLITDSKRQDCVSLLQRLDDIVDGSHVRDAEAYRIPGFPYLRSNRFLASFAHDVADSPFMLRDWLQAMRDLDQDSRDVEIRNLPAHAAQALGWHDKATLSAETQRCASDLMVADAGSAATIATLRAASAVPDNYSTMARALGLYPITSVPFLAGVNRWQANAASSFARLKTAGNLPAGWRRYIPPATRQQTDASEQLVRASRNTLGVPRYSAETLSALFGTYAPIFEVETHSEDDRPGALQWRNSTDLTVDVTRPVVYQRVAYTRLGNRVMTQLIYSLWFPRRTSDSMFDLLAGEFDGVMVRITLGDDGTPLIADSIHACGCYHLFFPGPRLKSRPPPSQHQEWAFIPAPLPAGMPASRLVIRLAAGTHYLTGIDISTSGDGIPYGVANENELRMLPLSTARTSATRSIYDPSGLIAGSERAERFLYWPMGVDSAGTMRQWGNHATAFVGRRHFDDAYLIGSRFELITAERNP